jgi:hypothetical protein
VKAAILAPITEAAGPIHIDARVHDSRVLRHDQLGDYPDSFRAHARSNPLLAKNGQSFIEKNPHQPAAETAFVLEGWSATGGQCQTALYRKLSLRLITEHTVRKKVECATISQQ